MIDITKVRHIEVPKDQHLARQVCYKNANLSLLESLNGITVPDVEAEHWPLIEFVLFNSKYEIPLASDRRWAEKQFGAVNTLQNSGCLPFTAVNMLALLGEQVDILQMTDIVVKRGYRYWKYANRPERLNWPEATPSRMRKQFTFLDTVQDDDEALKILGPIQGIGGHAYFLDEIISLLTGLEVYSETQIKSWIQILNNLRNGYPVPLRLNKGVLTGEKASDEGHYTNLIGFVDDSAVFVDSSFPNGNISVPFERFIEAFVYKNGARAWNTMPHAK